LQRRQSDARPTSLCLHVHRTANAFQCSQILASGLVRRNGRSEHRAKRTRRCAMGDAAQPPGGREHTQLNNCKTLGLHARGSTIGHRHSSLTAHAYTPTCTSMKKSIGDERRGPHTPPLNALLVQAARGRSLCAHQHQHLHTLSHFELGQALPSNLAKTCHETSCASE
jgi:hypothetical protein